MDRQCYDMTLGGRPRTRRRRKRRFWIRLLWCVLLVLAGMALQKGWTLLGGAVPERPETENAAGIPAAAAGRTAGKKADEKTADRRFLTLVNQDTPMAEGYVPELAEVENGYRFDARAADKLKAMLAAARQAGLDPIICSAYRDNATQTGLYRKQVQKQIARGLDRAAAEEKARTVVAYPGTSEHQLGLAADIVARSYQLLDDQQAQTAEARWLKEHCAEYGFILRYPTDKTSLTGVIFEPWHYRYVGEEAAREIMGQGICLEEYLES